MINFLSLFLHETCDISIQIGRIGFTESLRECSDEEKEMQQNNVHVASVAVMIDLSDTKKTDTRKLDFWK